MSGSTGVARAGVGDQRDAAHLEADPAGGDAFEHGRHPDGVTAEAGQHPDLGRGLVGRSGQADIDALLEVDALGGGGGVEGVAQARAPGVGQVGEARPELVGVRADQRAATGQVDVVAHDHQRARPEARVEAAGRVGQHDDPRAELLEQQDGLDDQARVVALVEVEAALEHHDRPPAEPPEQQPAGVSRRGRRRPAGQLRERDRDRVVELVGQPAEPGAEDDPDLRDERRPRADRGRPARRAAPAARWAGSGASGRRQGGRWVIAGLRSASYGRRPGPGASPARREYRHRDADHVPSGGSRSGDRGETSARLATKRPKRPAAERRSLMRSRVLRSCRPLRARPTLRARPVDGQRGYPRSPSTDRSTSIHELSAAVDRLWRTGGRPVSRPSRTSRSWAASTSPPSAARSSGRRAAARSPRWHRSARRRTRPTRRTARRSWPSTANRQV